METDLDRKVAELAARQAGLFSRRQLLELGADPKLIRRRLDRHRWAKVLAGVYRLRGAPSHPDSAMWRAVLKAGPGAHLFARSAAFALGFTGVPRPKLVSVNLRHPGCRRIPGVVVRQVGDVREHHLAEVRGLPVTTPARTILDLAADLGADQVRTMAQELVRSGRATPGRIARVLSEVLVLGKPGLHSMVALTDELNAARAVPETVLEELAHPLVVAAGFGEPVVQIAHPGRPEEWRSDFGLLLPRVLIETDGRTWHARYQQMRRDKERDQLAAGAGWLTLRFEWEQIVDDPAGVTERIRAACEVRMPGAA